MSSPNTSIPVLPRGYVFRQVGASFQAERTGLATAREKFIGYYDDFVTGAPLRIFGFTPTTTRNYKTPSPFLPSLLLYTSKITLGKGVMNGILEIEYRGLDPALVSIPPPVYSLERTVSNEPIITHPNFKTKIAGTPSTADGGVGPLNGASFVDKNGVYSPAPVGSTGTIDPASASFAGFSAKSKYAGVEDYLCPGAVWKATYVSYSQPSDLTSVGAPESPEGPVPRISGAGYNWLNMGLTFTDNAGLYRIEKSWRLSGPSGWDPDIYPGPSGLSVPGTLLPDGSIVS